MVLEEESGCKERKEKLSKKIIVRKLPPSFTEEEFRNGVQPLADHNYFSFIAADKSLGIHAFSRAYINFLNQEDVFIFCDQFDGYVFVDQRGNEYPALVEYAPFPKIPKQTKQRSDPRCGTIDDDEDYLAFLETLKDESNSAVPQIEAMLEEIEKEERLLKAALGTKTKTPLLDFIEQRASDRQKMIERRKRRDIDRKKSREEDRKKRKESAKKREEAFKEEREKARLKKEQKERSKKVGNETDHRENRDEKIAMQAKSIESIDTKEEFNRPKHTKSAEPAPIKTKRYSEVRKREEREKRTTVTSMAHEELANPLQDTDADHRDDKPAMVEEAEKLPGHTFNSSAKAEPKERSTDNESSKESRTAKRIRNKDRPDMQLYRPAHLRLKSTKLRDCKMDGNSSSSSCSPIQGFSEPQIGIQEGETSKPPLRAESDHSIDFTVKVEDSEGNNSSEIGEKISKSVKGGKSYNQVRESRKNILVKATEDGSLFKSKTYRRSNEE